MSVKPNLNPGMENAPLPTELRGLFDQYRSSLPDVEPGRDFTPQLWKRIDARRRGAMVFGRLARLYVTAAAGICILLVGLQWAPFSAQSSPVVTATYVDALSVDAVDDTVDPEVESDTI